MHSYWLKIEWDKNSSFLKSTINNIMMSAEAILGRSGLRHPESRWGSSQRALPRPITDGQGGL